jgi:hypothetical protein
MGLEYKGFTWTERVSGDYESVDRYMHEGLVKPTAPSEGELLLAAEWLATYGAESTEDAQKWANVIAYLVLSAESKAKRTALAKAKREFAKANGIKVSQVRVKK